MIRRPPRSTLDRSSAASDVYKRQDITLPEDATLLVTVLDDVLLEQYTLGDHLIAGLEDVLAGRTVEVGGDQELADYLNTVLGEA